MGRSFALDMGSLIPRTDQRLGMRKPPGYQSAITKQYLTIRDPGTIESYGANKVDVASDFIAQYTTRQKYRYPGMHSSGNLPGSRKSANGRQHKCLSLHFRGTDACLDSHLPFAVPSSINPLEHVERTLSHMCNLAGSGGEVLLSEAREILGQAAAILCAHENPPASLTYYLVTLPFEMFSRESMSLGISFWLGVINENPRVEPKVLVEVMSAWERSIERQKGLFDPSFE